MGFCQANYDLWGRMSMLFRVTRPGHHGNMAEWTKAESLLNMEGARSAADVHEMWVAAIRGIEVEGQIACKKKKSNKRIFFDLLTLCCFCWISAGEQSQENFSFGVFNWHHEQGTWQTLCGINPCLTLVSPQSYTSLTLTKTDIKSGSGKLTAGYVRSHKCLSHYEKNHTLSLCGRVHVTAFRRSRRVQQP